MIQYSFVFCIEVLGFTESGTYVGPVIETIIGIGYLAAFLFALKADLATGEIRHLTLVLIISIILRIFILFLVKIGIALAGVGLILMGFSLFVGQDICMLYMASFKIFGVSKLMSSVAFFVAFVFALGFAFCQ